MSTDHQSSIVTWTKRLSGGLIRTDGQAYMVLLVGSVVLILISVYLVWGSSSSPYAIDDFPGGAMPVSEM